MDIKQENVFLLLEKIKELLSSLPEDAKKDEKFKAAEKALNQLDTLFAGKESGAQIACQGKQDPY